MILFSSCTGVRKTFRNDVKQHFYEPQSVAEFITEEKIRDLPAPLQRYLDVCGFVGQEMPMNAEFFWKSSSIKMKPGMKKMLKLKTYQYNSVIKPFRAAYMKTYMAGIIPFEGRDIYADGQGHMLGRLGKIIRIFDEKQMEIGQSALIIILAETLMVPGYIFQDYMHWEEVDDHCVTGRIQCEGYSVSGKFYFNDRGEYIRFETSERYYLSPEKGNVQEPFMVEVFNYQTKGSYTYPRKVSASWILPEGKYEYWQGEIEEIRFNTKARF